MATDPQIVNATPHTFYTRRTSNATRRKTSGPTPRAIPHRGPFRRSTSANAACPNSKFPAARTPGTHKTEWEHQPLLTPAARSNYTHAQPLCRAGLKTPPATPYSGITPFTHTHTTASQSVSSAHTHTQGRGSVSHWRKNAAGQLSPGERGLRGLFTPNKHPGHTPKTSLDAKANPAKRGEPPRQPQCHDS